MIDNPQVKDVVYKVINDWIENKLVVASFKILSISRKNIIRVYRVGMPGKTSQHFHLNEVYSNPEEAISQNKIIIQERINKLQIELQKLTYLDNIGCDIL